MALVALSQMSCAQNEMNAKAMNDNITFTSETKNPNSNSDTATFGMGCFWCSEAIFQQIKGVTSITSGFSGGTVKNPSYREVCMGTTGHAEVVQVTYNPAEVSYEIGRAHV